MPDSLACSAALSLKSTTGLNASYAVCSGQSVYCRIFCQSCVRSRCGRLFLGMKYTSRNGFDTPIVHHPSCQDKRSGPPGPSANMCEESSGQVCPQSSFYTWDKGCVNDSCRLCNTHSIAMSQRKELIYESDDDDTIWRA